MLEAEGRDFYFKHFTMQDMLILDESYDFSLKNAAKRGIKTEKELIEVAIKRGFWSKALEEETKSLEWSIEKIDQAKNKSSDPNQKKSIGNSINEKKDKLKDIAQKRQKITGISAESFAENQKIKLLLKLTCFKDKGFTEPISEQESLLYLVPCLNKLGEFNDRIFLLNIAYNTSFFELFCLHYRQPHVIFNKSGFDLSSFQKNLLVYSNSLLNKLKNVSIPENILRDPVKILEYEEKRGSDKKTEGIEDLKQKFKNSGGALKPEDFLS